jgi:hypothetical protein
LTLLTGTGNAPLTKQQQVPATQPERRIVTMTRIDLDSVLAYLDELYIALGKEGRGNVEMDETIDHLIAQVKALKIEEQE